MKLDRYKMSALEPLDVVLMGRMKVESKYESTDDYRVVKCEASRTENLSIKVPREVFDALSIGQTVVFGLAILSD
jgi:hypothetical protein